MIKLTYLALVCSCLALTGKGDNAEGFFGFGVSTELDHGSSNLFGQTGQLNPSPLNHATVKGNIGSRNQKSLETVVSSTTSFLLSKNSKEASKSTQSSKDGIQVYAVKSLKIDTVHDSEFPVTQGSICKISRSTNLHGKTVETHKSLPARVQPNSGSKTITVTNKSSSPKYPTSRSNNKTIASQQNKSVPLSVNKNTAKTVQVVFSSRTPNSHKSQSSKDYNKSDGTGSPRVTGNLSGFQSVTSNTFSKTANTGVTANEKGKSVSSINTKSISVNGAWPLDHSAIKSNTYTKTKDFVEEKPSSDISTDQESKSKTVESTKFKSGGSEFPIGSGGLTGSTVSSFEGIIVTGFEKPPITGFSTDREGKSVDSIDTQWKTTSGALSLGTPAVNLNSNARTKDFIGGKESNQFTAEGFTGEDGADFGLSTSSGFFPNKSNGKQNEKMSTDVNGFQREGRVHYGLGIGYGSNTKKSEANETFSDNKETGFVAKPNKTQETTGTFKAKPFSDSLTDRKGKSKTIESTESKSGGFKLPTGTRSWIDSSVQGFQGHVSPGFGKPGFSADREDKSVDSVETKSKSAFGAWSPDTPALNGNAQTKDFFGSKDSNKFTFKVIGLPEADRAHYGLHTGLGSNTKESEASQILSDNKGASFVMKLDKTQQTFEAKPLREFSTDWEGKSKTIEYTESKSGGLVSPIERGDLKDSSLVGFEGHVSTGFGKPAITGSLADCEGQSEGSIDTESKPTFGTWSLGTPAAKLNADAQTKEVIGSKESNQFTFEVNRFPGVGRAHYGLSTSLGSNTKKSEVSQTFSDSKGSGFDTKVDKTQKTVETFKAKPSSEFSTDQEGMKESKTVESTESNLGGFELPTGTGGLENSSVLGFKAHVSTGFGKPSIIAFSDDQKGKSKGSFDTESESAADTWSLGTPAAHLNAHAQTEDFFESKNSNQFASEVNEFPGANRAHYGLSRGLGSNTKKSEASQTINDNKGASFVVKLDKTHQTAETFETKPFSEFSTDREGKSKTIESKSGGFVSPIETSGLKDSSVVGFEGHVSTGFSKPAMTGFLADREEKSEGSINSESKSAFGAWSLGTPAAKLNANAQTKVIFGQKESNQFASEINGFPREGRLLYGISTNLGSNAKKSEASQTFSDNKGAGFAAKADKTQQTTEAFETKPSNKFSNDREGRSKSIELTELKSGGFVSPTGTGGLEDSSILSFEGHVSTGFGKPAMTEFSADREGKTEGSIDRESKSAIGVWSLGTPAVELNANAQAKGFFGQKESNQFHSEVNGFPREGHLHYGLSTGPRESKTSGLYWPSESDSMKSTLLGFAGSTAGFDGTATGRFLVGTEGKSYSSVAKPRNTKPRKGFLFSFMK